jgi:hypothetical protein
MKQMSIYLIIFITICGFFPGIAFAQNLTLTKVGEWGTAPYLDVFVQGNYAYCVTGRAGLEIFDISSPSNPIKTGRCDTPGYAIDVFVSNNVAYVADDEKGVQIIDVSNPAAPTQVGNYQTTGTANDVFVSGNYAYVADNGSGLLVLDVSIPSSPTLAATYNTSGTLYSVWVKGNYAYLLDRFTGLHIINVSVPSTPTPVGTYATSWAILYNFKVVVSNNYAYVADYATGLQIIDVSNPSNPTLAGYYDGTLSATAGHVIGNYAYLTVFETELQVINISNPAAPTLVGHLDTSGNPVGIRVSGNHAYVADSEGGLAVINVSTPSSPTLVGNYDDAGDLRRVYVNANHAYATDRIGRLKVIDVSAPSSPTRVGNYDAFETVSGLDTAGNYVYAVSAEGTLYIIDGSNPSSPSQVSVYNPSAGMLTDVDINGNYAYVLSGYYGLRVIDVSVPSSPAQVGSYDIYPVNAYAQIRDVHVSGNYAYIAPEKSTLYVIDVSIPSAPTLAASYNTPNVVLGVYVSGNYAYAAVSSSGLYILDISTPSSPTLVGTYNTAGEAFNVYVSGNYAYVADYESGLQIIDVSNPSSPTLAASYDTPGTATGVYASGNYVYVADGVSGKLIILAATDASITPEISLNRTVLYFGAEYSGERTGAQYVLIENSGEGNLKWSASVDQSWLSCSPTSGINSGEVSVSVDTTGLSPGTYTGAVTVADPLAINSPQRVAVTLKVYQTGRSSVPFGVFATPVDGSTVSSSIPVTGWVLDDIGIQSVQLFRKVGNSLAYIGDALLVEGARPDVELAYPGYPMNYKAGWGYMMLTNFLPGGDGDFTIHAIATDMEGQQVTLGIKRITVDNANAVKPFGAIDTPIQGGTASGSHYRNHGWVLTPMPNAIPDDGSTIDVYINGVYLGHPVYNVYREDIATLFPDYANSKGAHAYFDFDTTVYSNGVHTIYWTAADNAGNTDGIGSRYFTIQNSYGAGRTAVFDVQRSMFNFKRNQISVDQSHPVFIKKGYHPHTKPLEVYPDDKGIITIEIRELEGIEVRLFPVGTAGLAPLLFCTGYQLVGPQYRPLPIGSTLDPEKGIFYWQPGPGFIGVFEFIFIEKQVPPAAQKGVGPQEAANLNKKHIFVRIGPK